MGNLIGYKKRHGRNDLDLSLSVRFANLAAGAKLSLVACSTPVSTIVTIALQTEEHGRLIDKFSTETSFWDILKHFERSKSGVELTVRTGIPSKDGLFGQLASLGKTPMYIMPVCVFMNKEVCIYCMDMLH